MGEASNIIKRIATEGHKIQTCPAKVVAINEQGAKTLHDTTDAYTVDVVRPDGALICNVRLKASIQNKEEGFICVPKLNSWVLISIIETTETRAFISQYSEIEEIFLRIRQQDGAVAVEDTFLELKANGTETKLGYKKVETNAESPQGISRSYKNLAKIVFGEDRILNVKFWNEQQETTQETRIAHDNVKINFDEGEGYQANLNAESVTFNHSNKGLDFQLTDKFLVKAGGNNLKTELDKLITEISKIIVVQGTGPNTGALNSIKNNIAAILTE